MAKNPTRIFDRLVERNPSVDRDGLVEAFADYAKSDSELSREILREVFHGVWPVIEKKVAGKSLTKGERAILKMLSGRLISDAELALATECYDDNVARPAP